MTDHNSLKMNQYFDDGSHLQTIDSLMQTSRLGPAAHDSKISQSQYLTSQDNFYIQGQQKVLRKRKIWELDEERRRVELELLQIIYRIFVNKNDSFCEQSTFTRQNTTINTTLSALKNNSQMAASESKQSLIQAFLGARNEYLVLHAD